MSYFPINYTPFPPPFGWYDPQPTPYFYPPFSPASHPMAGPFRPRPQEYRVFRPPLPQGETIERKVNDVYGRVREERLPPGPDFFNERGTICLKQEAHLKMLQDAVLASDWKRAICLLEEAKKREPNCLSYYMYEVLLRDCIGEATEKWICSHTTGVLKTVSKGCCAAWLSFIGDFCFSRGHLDAADQYFDQAIAGQIHRTILPLFQLQKAYFLISRRPRISASSQEAKEIHCLLTQVLEGDWKTLKRRGTIVLAAAVLLNYLGFSEEAARWTAELEKSVPNGDKLGWLVPKFRVLQMAMEGKQTEALRIWEQLENALKKKGLYWVLRIQLTPPEGKEGLSAIEGLLNRALASDSPTVKSGEIWCEYARLLMMQDHLFPSLDSNRLELARDAIEKAISLTPSYGDSHIERLHLIFLQEKKALADAAPEEREAIRKRFREEREMARRCFIESQPQYGLLLNLCRPEGPCLKTDLWKAVEIFVETSLVGSGQNWRLFSLFDNPDSPAIPKSVLLRMLLEEVLFVPYERDFIF